MAAQFIGATISLVSKSDIRYQGVLHSIDAVESTVSLEHVRSLGTEGRKGDPSQELPPSDKVYEFIVFRASDVKDLKIVDPNQPAQPPPPQAQPDDPAIVGTQNRAPAVASPPPAGGGPSPAPYQQQQQQRFPQHSPYGPPGGGPGQQQGFYGPPGGQYSPFGGPGGPGFPPGYGPPPGFGGGYGGPPPPPGFGYGPPGGPQGGWGPPPPPHHHLAPPPPLQQQQQQGGSSAPPSASPNPVNPPPPTEIAPSPAPSAAPSTAAAPPQQQQQAQAPAAASAAAPKAAAPAAPEEPKKPLTLAQIVSKSKTESLSKAAAKVASEKPEAVVGAPPPSAPAAVERSSGLEGGVQNLNLGAANGEQQQQFAGRGGRGGGRGSTRGGPGRGGNVPMYGLRSVPEPQANGGAPRQPQQQAQKVLQPFPGGQAAPLPGSDFDFESSNAKFSKSDEQEVEISAPSSDGFYNKSSFFDNISSDIKQRSEGTYIADGQGREGRQELQRRNMDTFGESGAGMGNGFRGRGRGRGGRGRGGGGAGGRGRRPNGNGAGPRGGYAQVA